MKSLISVLIACMFLYSGYLKAQNDSIESARKLSYEKKYEEALILLKSFEKNHPNEINSVRLHAQVLYWMKEYKAALELCETFLKANPNSDFLKLDYGRMLFNLQRWSKAKLILTNYLATDASNVEAQNMLATITFWQGKIANSKTQFNSVLQNYPSNEWALDYLSQLKLATAPYVKITGGYNSDTQPFSNSNGGLEAGIYKSNLLSPKINFLFQNYDSSGIKRNSYAAAISNKFFFSGIGTEINVSAGMVQPLGDTSVNWIGSFEVSKQLLKNLSLSVSAARKNYQYTLSNFHKAILHNDYSAALTYYKEKKWSAQTAYTELHFDDKNTIKQYYAWLLSPALQFSKFEFYLGYNFNFATSKNNRYNLTASPEESIVQYDSTGKIPVLYTPYFTPQNQVIHSAIAKLIIKPSVNFLVALHASYGFSAKADSPYLYFDNNENGQLIIVRDYFSQKYTPLELSGKLNYKISTRVSIEANYVYSKAFFFENNAFNLSLKYIFLNGKRR